MESQLHRQHGHHGYEEEPGHVGLRSVVAGEGEGEHHPGEKKSVLKKVKDKAKKIKDTIKKHGHGHEHGHGQSSEEEEEDKDEEMVDDPEVHDAPMYESSAIRITDLGQGISPGQTGVNLEKPTDTREDRFDTNVRDEGITRPSASGGIRDNLGMTTAMETDEAMNSPSAPGEMQNEAINRSSVPDDMGRATTRTSFGKVDDSPVMGREEANMRVKIGQPVGLEEDPHSPKNIPEAIPPSNYQSKVADPTGTGGKEADVGPLVHQFDKMNVQDQTGPKSKSESEQRLYTGSHNQFAPQTTPTTDQFTPQSNTIRTETGSENPESTLERLDPSKKEDSQPDTLTGKLSYATSAIADKAISAKNVVVSKLGYGGHEEGGHEESRDSQKPVSEPTKPVSETASEYAHSVAATMTEKLAPVYHKVADASSTVISKVQGSGIQDEGGERAAHLGNEGAATKGTDKGLSVKDYLAEKFRPGDEDKALSEAISSALHKKKGETGKSGEEKPIEKVTESEQLARRLGTGTENKREGEDALSAGNESRGTGMVDKIKDAVGSWLGKSEGMRTAKDSLGQSHVSDTSSAPTQGNEHRQEVSGHR
ncbi:low-temperature-induced 65 kDa protein-like isoform X1 [Olea europaea var. sylvestris]|uniref:low-temperature-induced 65 kDa protein-like isoform X1 n=2 Tax=Olea europaea var. sylvestris TaxID=158386 RepID=UPI000C1D1E64|nr:low-temperature-induced 65 kDa protein-like isoform X1 [Olea europaea var. sylvestris]